MDLRRSRRSSHLVIAIFALVGVVASMYMYVIVDPTVNFSILDTPGYNASLEVLLFDNFRYIRIAPKTPFFILEFAFWKWGLPILILLSGPVGGGFAGYLVDRWLRRAPWRIGA